LLSLYYVSGFNVQWPLINNGLSVPSGYDGQFFNVYLDGNAAVFDRNIESYMEVPYTANLNPPTFSVAVWVLTSQDPNSGLDQPRTILTSRHLGMQNGTYGARGYSIQLNTKNQYVGSVGCATTSPTLFYGVLGPNACTDDGCYDHLVWQCSAAQECQLWVGKTKYWLTLETPFTAPLYIPQTTNNLRVGASTGTASGCAGGGSPSYCNGFSGVIKNVRINDRFLTEQEIGSAVDKGPDEIKALSTGAAVGVFFLVVLAVMVLGGAGSMFLKKWKKQQVEGHSKLDD